MLREIKHPNNSTINLVWDKASIGDFAHRVSAPITIKDDKSIGEDTRVEVSEYGGESNALMYNYTSVLSKITFTGGTVDFTYSNVTKKQFLSTIVVKNTAGSEIKKINFYYGGNNVSQYLLTSLKINQEVYNFKYNALTYTKASTGLDYWGFYNGKDSNSSHIPRVYLKLYNIFSTVNFDDRANENMWVGYADKSVSPEHMKAFMLTRIYYPTGGYSDFEYEPHKFTNQNIYSSRAFVENSVAPINQGGGLRVSKITTKESTEAVATIKTYVYGEKENGLANANYIPTLDTFIDEACVYEPYSAGLYYIAQVSRHLYINSSSNYLKYIINQAPIWYNKVTEYINDHKIEYSFTYREDSKGINLQYKRFNKPYTNNYSSLFQDGPRLTQQIKYIKNGQTYSPVEKTVMSYNSVRNGDISNQIIERAQVLSDHRGTASDWGVNPDFYKEEYLITNGFIPNTYTGYRTSPYTIELTYYTIGNKQTSILNGDNFITTTEEYEYNTPALLKKMTTSTSNSSQSIIKIYKHVGDYTSGIYPVMQRKNILSPVIEEVTSMKTNGNTIELSKIQTNYTLFNRSNYKPSSVQTSVSGANVKMNIDFDKYSAMENLLQYTTLDGISTVYLWGYNYQYPIAEIKNATYEQVKNILTEALINRVASSSVPSSSDILAIDNLRKNTTLPNILVSTFKYKIMVGMIEATDPSGNTTTYEYDTFNRLEFVKDRDLRKVQENKYNYKNQ